MTKELRDAIIREKVKFVRAGLFGKDGFYESDIEVPHPAPLEWIVPIMPELSWGSCDEAADPYPISIQKKLYKRTSYKAPEVVETADGYSVYPGHAQYSRVI